MRYRIQFRLLEFGPLWLNRSHWEYSTLEVARQHLLAARAIDDKAHWRLWDSHMKCVVDDNHVLLEET